MTLAEDLLALLELQAVDSRLDRLRAALAGLDSGAATAAAYNTGKAEFESRRATMLKCVAEQHDAEMRLQTIETKSGQVTKSLYDGSVIGARELSNLQKELDMLGRQKNEAEEKVLAAMEAAAEATTLAEALEAELTALADKYRATRAAYKVRHAELSAEIAAEDKVRAAAAKPISAALLSKYDAIRLKKGGIGATVAVQSDNTCGACHTRLNSGLIDAVRAAATVHLCEYCGRILVARPGWEEK